MIASAVFLSVTTPPALGSARPTGGPAFALPGEMPADVLGEAAVGDDASPPIDGDRQDDAAPGNPLPDAPLDPWLLTLVAPSAVAATPTKVPASNVAPRVQSIGDRPVDVNRAAPVASPLPVLPAAALPNVAAPPADIADAAIPRPGDRAATPAAPPSMPTARVPTGSRGSGPTLPPTQPVAADLPSTVDRAMPASNDATPTAQAPAPASPTLTPVVMPAVALGTSALTPLRRQEIAAVAALVDAAHAPVTIAGPVILRDARLRARRTDDAVPNSVANVVVPAKTNAGTSLDTLPASMRLIARADVAGAETTPAIPDIGRPSLPPPIPAIGQPRAAAPQSAALPIGWTLTVPAAAPATSMTPPVVEASTIAPVAALLAAPSPPPATAMPTTALPVETVPAVDLDRSLAPSIAPGEARAAARPAIEPPRVFDAAPAAPPPTAAIAFGAARFAARRDDPRTDPRAPALGDAVAGVAPTGSPIAAPAVSAPIDVRHERWPTAMIERIEMVREAVAEAADAADTRIRLVPDALGAIDVDVRRDGDTLHVRFTAEQPQTRALLHDAQPRLAEAAEQRGLRLGQTSVGGDAPAPGQQPVGQQSSGQQSPGQQSGQQHPGQQRQPLAPAPTSAPRSTVAAADADADDTRLA